jgi:hypothetical protein
VHDSTTIPIGAIGTGKKSWTLSGDYQIAGVTVDNPSGSWLWIPADNTFVPPYTLGFAHSFAPTLSRIDILFANGPSGQLSTIEGDAPTAQIYDLPVAESAGVQSSTGASFVDTTARLLVQQTLAINVKFSGGTNIMTIVPGTGKRVRIFTIVANSFTSDSPVLIDVLDTTSAVYLEITLSPELPTVNLTFTDGLDLPVSEQMIMQAVSSWADSVISATVTYRVI